MGVVFMLSAFVCSRAQIIDVDLYKGRNNLNIIEIMASSRTTHKPLTSAK